MSLTYMARALLGAVALLSWGCGPEYQAVVCHGESDKVMPDEKVRGARIGDLLEPYFGDQQGTLSWEAGEETALTLSVPYKPGTPFQLSNVSQCDARNVSYWAHAHVTTDDRAFDNEISVSVGSSLPGAGVGAVPRSVASFAVLTDWQWQPALRDKLGVSLDRYSSSYVVFELDWAMGAPAPTGGILRWRGTLALDSEVSDTLQVATLRF